MDIIAHRRSLEIILGGVFVIALLAIGIAFLNRRNHPLARTLRATQLLLVPTAIVLFLLVFEGGLSFSHRLVKITQTILGVEMIWIVLSLVTVLLFARAESDTWRARVPRLLVDILRFGLVIIGGALVVVVVWDRDLGGLLATVGVGSIVLGLALQDTLGSLMAGIALLIDRPFNVGDWVQVGDLIGKVVEVNWRSVKVCTRDTDIVIVPNSTLGKERIQNFSRPTVLHASRLYVSFSYGDPPNKVRHVLHDTALMTRGALSEPAPRIRTKSYQDSGIQYEIKFYMTDLDGLPDIESELMTRIWYAAKRNGLTIPYPTRIVHKTEVAPQAEKDRTIENRKQIRRVPIFSTLLEDEVDSLAHDATVQNFARGESVVRQGESGDKMYIICSGLASVAVQDERGEGQEIAQIGEGDFFGEMSLLSGAKRSATVSVLEDLEVIVIYKGALEVVLERRPDLAAELAGVVAKRQHEMEMANAGRPSSKEGGVPPDERTRDLFVRIRDFFKL